MGGSIVRIACTGFAALALTVAGLPVHAQTETQSEFEDKRDFNIPAQSLASALNELSRQSNIVVTAPSRLTSDRLAPAIYGSYTPHEALQALLAGSGLYIRRTGSAFVVTDEKETAISAAHGEGVIAGRVFEPATGQYLRNAIIKLNGRQVTTSGDRGEFRIDDVPAGPVQLSVEFTGYTAETVEFSVTAGKVVQQDIELRSSLGGAASVETVQVVGVREGDARAIMEQRAAMNITNTLSADSFGEIGDGNPAEFLKYMPGVDFDVVADDVPRTISLRGLPANYTGVTINGISLGGGVDANATTSRSFSFEQLSLTGIDSISVSKTTSADMDANAPAGTIDIRTRKAFDRKGREIIVQFGGSTHTGLWDNYETGPMEGGYGGKKFLPSGKITYSDVFLDGRLGVTAGLNDSTSLIEHIQTTAGRNYVPTAASPDPYAVTEIAAAFYDREYNRQSASLGVDFKATDDLIFSLVASANRGDIEPSTVTPTFTTNARSRGVVGGGDPALDFTTNSTETQNTLGLAHTYTYKVGNTKSAVPSFEWNSGRFKLDGNLFWSTSDSRYDSADKGQVSALLNPVTSRGNFSARRSGLREQDWQIQQISGPDWSDPASFTLGAYSATGQSAATARPVIRTTTGSTAESEFRGGGLNFSFDRAIGSLPVTWKTGFKVAQTGYEFGNNSDALMWTYNGPLTNAQFLEAVRSANENSFAHSGMRVTTLSGGGLYDYSLAKIFDMMRANPDEWTHTMSAANWYSANVANVREYDEDIHSLYGMGTFDFTAQLKVQAGLRWEQTRSASHDFNPLGAAEVAAAGYEVSAATGRATTIEGLQYQYLTNGRIKRKSDYSNLFPSASVKYSFTDSFDLIAGYSRTIQRPEVSVLAGVWSASIGAEETIVTAPNPNLEPEFSDNFSLRAVQYFEPVGLVAVNYYRNRIKNGIVTENLSADEFGYTGTEYADATFVTSVNRSDETIDIQGYEFEFNHAMDYLPGALRGTTVRGSYLYVDTDRAYRITANRVATKVAQFGLGWNYNAVSLKLNAVWANEKSRGLTGNIAIPNPDGDGTVNINQWQPFKPYLEVNMSGSYTLVQRGNNSFLKGLEIYFSANNLFGNHRGTWYRNSEAGLAGSGHHSQIDIYSGQKATLGMRARF
ncbi:TonB-dependent receptor domain-containing protein [Steroidobacter cummioxidans]|uniref:TonB-dependent receptor domain-containing protein n=1 Tax=Steroidobacter cummioxidans TaxID=1803913 RepID=UPI00137A207C|nr:TonB-dependent receptor [Steroidobacter cummioxidans]